MESSAVIGAAMRESMKESWKAFRPLYRVNTCSNHLVVRVKSRPQVLNSAPKGTQMYIMMTNSATREQNTVSGTVTDLSSISILARDALPVRVAAVLRSR